jgi:hypothetical protein
VWQVGIPAHPERMHELIPSGSLAGEVLLEESIWLAGPSMILYAG